MAEKLKPIDVMRKPPGFWAAGNGLYLSVGASGARSWLYRYMLNGRTRDMGLGSIRDVPTIKTAMELRERWAKLKAQGVDPIEERRREEAAKDAANGKTVMTFADCADAWLEKARPEFSNQKYTKQVESQIKRYCLPVLGKRAAQDIDEDAVLKVLQPIWQTKNPTATKVRGYIEQILNWAKAAKQRSGDNPAAWEQLSELLPAPNKVHAVEHHASVPYEQMPDFMADLRSRNSISARLLEFTVLTVSRAQESTGARWDEVNWDDALWTVPKERMKGRKNKRRPHAVPLSSRVLQILRDLRSRHDGPFVFAGQEGKPLTTAAMEKMLEIMGRSETPHGMRSSFRTWINEETSFPRELAEMALHHLVGDDVERAYQRGDGRKKRYELMTAWANYCGGQAAGNVVSMPGKTGRR
jgi:integrase